MGECGASSGREVLRAEARAPTALVLVGARTSVRSRSFVRGVNESDLRCCNQENMPGI